MTRRILETNKEGLALFAVCLLAAGFFGAGVQQQLERKPTQPVCMDDASRIVQKLRPMTNGNATDAEVWVWADGRVNIEFTTPDREEFQVIGYSLPEALEELKRKVAQKAMMANAVQKALEAP